MPGISASACAAPTLPAWRQETRSAIRLSSSGSVSRSRRAPAQPLGAEQQEAVDEQEDRGRRRRGEYAAQRALEREPEDAGGNRADDEQPAEPRVGVVGAISRSRSERPSPLKMRTQSFQKNPSSTSAVARWTATRNVMKYLSFWWMFQPNRRGNTTAWPRLEIGNSSENP